MAGEEAGCGRLLTDDVDDILTVEIAGVAQEGLFALIVVGGVIDKFSSIAAIGLAGDAVGYGPAGESPGAFLYVFLGVVELAVHAHTHGEQLQQLPAVI